MSKYAAVSPRHPTLEHICGAIADAASVIETATHSIEATEHNAPAAVTLRMGLGDVDARSVRASCNWHATYQ
jgi:hypothetical protein